MVVASVTEADPQERSARHSVWFGSNNSSAQLKNISIIIPSFAILILAEVEGKINGFNVPFVSGKKEWICFERVLKKGCWVSSPCGEEAGGICSWHLCHSKAGKHPAVQGRVGALEKATVAKSC